MSTYYDERVQFRPVDKGKTIELHQKYKEIKASGVGPKNKPWTRDHCIALGVLYYQSWGIMPGSRRMDSVYSMPHNKQIKRLFGTFEVFYEEIIKATQISDIS